MGDDLKRVEAAFKGVDVHLQENGRGLLVSPAECEQLCAEASDINSLIRKLEAFKTNPPR